MAIVVLDTYPPIIKFPKIEAGIGKITTSKQKFEPYSPDWFQNLEQELLHPETNRKVLKLHKKTLGEIWEQKGFGNSVFWSKNLDGRHIEPAQIYYTKNNEKRIIPAREILDDDYGKNKKQNDTIFNIREICRSNTLMGRGNYENNGYYGYKSKYHKELFLEIVQALGLPRKAEVKQTRTEIYDSAGGFYHKVSLLSILVKKFDSIDYHSRTSSEIYNEESEEDEF